MAIRQKAKNTSAPNIQALGLKSPMEVIDILALLKIDGEPIIKEDKLLLNPNTKAQAVMKYFQEKFKLPPQDLPYLASLIKHDLKHGKIGWRKR